MFEKDEAYRKARKESKDKITKVISAWSAREETLHDAGFQDGAEFGYKTALEQCAEKFAESNRKWQEVLDKANEWHYVKDGDLPKEIKEYLVYMIDGYGCESIQVMQFNNQHCWCANCQNKIKAWKEIVLP